MRTRIDMKTMKTHRNNTQGARRTSSVPPLGNSISSIESEVRTVMGGIWKNGFTRMALLSVLALVMVFGAVGFADAAPITVVREWPAAADAFSTDTTASGSATVSSLTAGAGTNRVLVFSLNGEGTANQTSCTCSATFGSASATQVSCNAGLSGYRYNCVGYFQEGDIQANNGSNMVATINLTPGNIQTMEVRYAVYQNVEQGGGTTTVPGFADDGSNNTTSTVNLAAASIAEGFAFISHSSNATGAAITAPTNYTLLWDADDAETGTNMQTAGFSRGNLPGGTETVTYTSDDARWSSTLMTLRPVSCTDGTPTSAIIPGSQQVGGIVDLTTLYTMDPGGNGTVTGYTIDAVPQTSPWDSTGITGPQGVTFCVEYSDPDCGGTTGSDCNTVTVDNTCSEPDAATLTVTTPTSGGTLKSNPAIKVTVGNEDQPDLMANMAITIAGSSACDVTGDTTGWVYSGAYVWTYSWTTTGCGIPAENPITIDVQGNDPNCGGLVIAPQITNVTLDTSGPIYKVTSCADCHNNPPLDDASRNTTSGDFPGTHTVHATDFTLACTVCHVDNGAALDHRNGRIEMASPIYSGTGAYSSGGSFDQVDSPIFGTCSNVYCHDPSTITASAKTTGDPTPQWGTTQPCDLCHDNPPFGSSKYNHSGVTPGSCGPSCHPHDGGTAAEHLDGTLQASASCTVCHASSQNGRDAVVGEFGLAWGHKKSGRGAVTDEDCIICHLEGLSTGGFSGYHGDGNIDLRDPDGVSAETAITNNSGGAFTFSQYAVSYAAGSRTQSLGNTVAEVITVKFCLACHDGDGMTNPANTIAGGNAAMPFGGVALGANYTAANDAIGTQGLIDVASQVASGNSSRHPVGAPNSRMYPYSDRLAVPYNNINTVRDSNLGNASNNGSNTAGNGVVMVCDDCHTDSTTIASRMTTRTLTAHGGSSSIAGTYFVSGPTLCLTCHIQGSAAGPYNDSTGTGNSTHNLGSGFAGNTTRARNALNYCNMCHFSQNTNYAAANRPRYAQDVHGFNQMYSGGGWPGGNASGMLPRAFMRSSQNDGGSWPNANSPRPYSAPGITTGSGNCGGSFAFNTGDSGASCSNNGHNNYQPAGSY